MFSAKAVLIDLDDTLFEERHYVESGFRAVARFLEQDRDLPADYSYTSMLAFLELEGRGKVFDRIIERFEVRHADGLVERCVAVYREHMPEIKLYPDVADTLERLSADFPLALVTNGLPTMQQNKIKALGIEPFFGSVVLCDGLSAPKPAPDGLLQAMSDLDVKPRETVFIGDNPATDGAAAHAAHVPFIRVRTKRFAETPSNDTGIATFSDVMDLLSAV